MSDEHEGEYRRRLQAALEPDFELRELIGRGGFGSVYAAWDRSLERRVAVKALRHDLFPTPVVLERFQREARVLARLRHPHVLPVYEVGQGEGVAFMVTPLIEGETLAELLSRGERIGSAEALRLVTEVARALHAAHRAGIVHRDVKPENILIEGTDRHAVLADFGIAKANAADGALTGTGIAMGSPHYMSPEQAAAEKELDGRSDIYSLGAVAYEMLTGRRPFVADSLQRLLVLQLTTDPPPLIASGVSDEAVRAVMRALEREPSSRWQTAGDFASALAESQARVTTFESQSWLARRGLLVAFLGYIGLGWVNVTTFVLSQSVSGQVRFIAEILSEPIVLLLRIFGVALAIELAVSLVHAWRNAPTNKFHAAMRAGFEQPRWWQAWYPKAVRHPDNAWDRMSFTVKAVRTVIWLELALLPLMLPAAMLWPILARMTAEAGIPLPLPVQVAFGLWRAIEVPLQVGAVVSVLGPLFLASRRGVRMSDAFRLMVTWRSGAWNSPAGRALGTSQAAPTSS